MKLVYLASVYSWPYDETVTPKLKEKRFKLAAKTSGKLMQKFEKVFFFSPIAHSHPQQRYAKLPFDFKWYQRDLEILSKCDELWILDMPGWDQSEGIKKELEKAKELNLPIFLVTPRLKVTEYESN